jgi:hypothetical protein
MAWKNSEMDSETTAMHSAMPRHHHHHPIGQGYDRFRIAVGVGLLCAILLARAADALIV